MNVSQIRLAQHKMELLWKDTGARLNRGAKPTAKILTALNTDFNFEF
jgi:hypothetical protein